MNARRSIPWSTRTIALRSGLAALLLSIFSCARIIFPGEEPGKIKVATTILPYREFIRAVGGERVVVAVLIPPGANPHTYELSPRQLAEAGRADLFVKTGSGIEFELVWLPKIIAFNPAAQVCDAARGIEPIGGEGHHPGGGREEANGRFRGKDPHVWLSPLNAKVIIENIRSALSELDPAQRDLYARNAREYGEKLDRLRREIQGLLSGLPDRAFVVLHPSWGYFARDFGLEQVAIEVEGKEPSPRDFARVIEEARRRKIRAVLVSPQANPRPAEIIAGEIEGRIATADPLAENYPANLLSVAEIIRESHE